MHLSAGADGTLYARQPAEVLCDAARHALRQRLIWRDARRSRAQRPLRAGTVFALPFGAAECCKLTYGTVPPGAKSIPFAPSRQSSCAGGQLQMSAGRLRGRRRCSGTVRDVGTWWQSGRRRLFRGQGWRCSPFQAPERRMRPAPPAVPPDPHSKRLRRVRLVSRPRGARRLDGGPGPGRRGRSARDAVDAGQRLRLGAGRRRHPSGRAATTETFIGRLEAVGRDPDRRSPARP